MNLLHHPISFRLHPDGRLERLPDMLEVDVAAIKRDQCRCPDCLKNPDGLCPDWLTGDCPGPNTKEDSLIQRCPRCGQSFYGYGEACPECRLKCICPWNHGLGPSLTCPIHGRPADPSNVRAVSAGEEPAGHNRDVFMDIIDDLARCKVGGCRVILKFAGPGDYSLLHRGYCANCGSLLGVGWYADIRNAQADIERHLSNSHQ